MTEYITIVSGLPRSGTSMMMQAIAAGGIEPLIDHIRESDVDNPRGYYEYEPVKKTKEDPSWLAQAGGKVVKMVYRLLYDLPADYPYRVVCMRRDLQEVLASQQKMLQRLGKPVGSPEEDEKMAQLFAGQLDQFDKWVAQQGNFRSIDVQYGDMVADPLTQSRRVSEFLDGRCDPDKMARAVDPSLYRNRAD